MSGIANVMSMWASKNIGDIKNEWNKSLLDGEANIDFRIVNDDKQGVVGEFHASGQKMWINEYGSGSMMDTSNPFLSQYKSSKLWNPERENNEIRTRMGVYSDLDGNPQIGSGLGGEHGLNAEKLYTDKNGNNKNQYHIAEPPKHIIKETLTGNTTYNATFKTSLLDAFGASIRSEITKVVHK